MTEFFNAVLAGLGQGSVYTLLALGFVIIYKATHVVSFAQPAFMMAGAVFVSYLVTKMPFFVALALGAVGIALVAIAVERVAVRPMVGEPPFVVAIITIGIDIVVRVVVNAFVGLNPRNVGDPWGLDSISIGPLTLAQRHLAMMVTAAILVGALFAFFAYTPIGLAMRAAAFDQESAMTQGVNVGTVFMLSWALAGGLAAVAGVFVATNSPIDQNIWIVALTALPAIIIGGLDSLAGAVVGGLTVGVVESLVATYQNDVAPWLGNNFAVVSPYVVMMLVLLVRPYGIFGTHEVERV